MSNKFSPQDIQIESKKAYLIAQHREMVSTWQGAQDVFTRLCRRLHLSLELDQCLAIFLEELRSVLAFNSFSYQHQEGRDNFVYTEGYGGQHRCEYNLSLEGESLGYLSLNRRSRFAEEELMVLEQIIGILIFSLRNCWHHRQALAAAMTDSITLLGNRRALLSALESTTPLSRPHQEPLALLLCDLDHFKQVNDNHGHIFGDHVLTMVSDAIRDSIRSSDGAFRFGGEEFAVLLPRTGMVEAMAVAERIGLAVENQHYVYEGGEAQVTISIGLAEYESAESPDDFIGRADKALYLAKRDGRNCVRKARTGATALQN